SRVASGAASGSLCKYPKSSIRKNDSLKSAYDIDALSTTLRSAAARPALPPPEALKALIAAVRSPEVGLTPAFANSVLTKVVASLLVGNPARCTNANANACLLASNWLAQSPCPTITWFGVV